MLLEGVTLECRAESVSPKSAPWEAVAVNVYLPLSTATHPDSRTTN